MKKSIEQAMLASLCEVKDADYIKDMYLTKGSISDLDKYLHKVKQAKIQEMYVVFYEAISSVLAEKLGISISVLVDASCDSKNYVAILWTNEDVVLHRVCSDPEKFYFLSEDKMLEYMVYVYDKMLDKICTHIERRNTHVCA